MKSTTGQYFQSLDHVRALAAFLVFAWHFNHVREGQYDAPLAPGLSFLTEGHTGVAIFMTLSGYIFAKLLDGQTVRFAPFLWNRFLRLAPLLSVVIVLVAVELALQGNLSWRYPLRIIAGAVLPTLPNGGWSITVEAHFYVILPLLLAASTRKPFALILILAAALLLRIVLFLQIGQIQDLAYWTIVGRIDQFLCGIIAFRFRSVVQGYAGRAALVLLGFTTLWWGFDLGGGFYARESYPSSTPLWIVLPTIEALAYGWLIAWYDDWYGSPNRKRMGYGISQVSAFIAAIGAYSYSIYLLHPFFVFRMGRWIDANLLPLDDRPYVTLLLSVPVFLLMVPVAYCSYRFIELPPMRLRRTYLVHGPEVRPIAGR